MISIGLKSRFRATPWTVLLAALAFACLPAGAQSSQQGGSSQDDSQAGQSDRNNQNPGNNNSQDTNTPAPQDAPFTGLNSVAPPQTQIYQIGTASLLSPIGRYHWGPLSLGSSDVRAAVDVIRPTNVAEGPAETDVLSLIETSINFDKQIGANNRLTFQYLPRIAVTNGQVAYDYLNQNVAIDSYFLLSPRWTLGLSDQFVLTSNQGLTGGAFADASAVTSTTLQNVFLNTNDTYLTNVAAAALSYSSSPRTIVIITPSLVYQHTSGFTNTEIGSIPPLDGDAFSSFNVTFDARFRYLVDARTSVGAYASTSLVQFSGLIPTSTYYTFGGSITRQLTMTTGVALDLGITESVFQSRQQYWSPSGTVTFFKVLRHGRISAVYTRGLPASGYVSNNLTQRVDAIAHYTFSPRLFVDTGFGYEAQDSGPDIVSGKYATGEMDYVLAPQWTVFGTYAYKIQNSNDIQVFSGTTNFASFGLRWTPNSSGIGNGH
jgi:hypothetical protein